MAEDKGTAADPVAVAVADGSVTAAGPREPRHWFHWAGFTSHVKAQKLADACFDEAKEEDREDAHLASAWGTARSLINAAVSGGVLALAFQIPRAGSGMVAMLILLGGVLLHITIMMLYKASLKLRVSSYTGAVRASFPGERGKWAERIVATSLGLGQFGILTGYANVLSDSLPWVIQQNTEGCTTGDEDCDLDWWLSSAFLIIMLMVFFILPISLRSNPDVFAKISFTTFIHFGLFSILVFVGVARYWPSNELPLVLTAEELDELSLPKSSNVYPPEDKVFRFNSDAVLAFSIIAFAAEAHTTAMPILHGTRIHKGATDDEKIAITSKIVGGSMASVAVYYTIIALGAYMAFGDFVEDNSLNSFPGSDALAQAVRATYTFELATSVPIYVYSMRRELSATYLGVKGGQAEMDQIEAANPIRTAAITITILTLSTTLGLLGSLQQILGFTSAIVTSWNTFCFPAALYYMLDIKGWERNLAPPIIVLGILTSIIALYAQIKNT